MLLRTLIGNKKAGGSRDHANEENVDKRGKCDIKIKNNDFIMSVKESLNAGM